MIFVWFQGSWMKLLLIPCFCPDVVSRTEWERAWVEDPNDTRCKVHTRWISYSWKYKIMKRCKRTNLSICKVNYLFIREFVLNCRSTFRLSKRLLLTIKTAWGTAVVSRSNLQSGSNYLELFIDKRILGTVCYWLH